MSAAASVKDDEDMVEDGDDNADAFLTPEQNDDPNDDCGDVNGSVNDDDEVNEGDDDPMDEDDGDAQEDDGSDMGILNSGNSSSSLVLTTLLIRLFPTQPAAPSVTRKPRTMDLTTQRTTTTMTNRPLSATDDYPRPASSPIPAIPAVAGTYSQTSERSWETC